MLSSWAMRGGHGPVPVRASQGHGPCRSGREAAVMAGLGSGEGSAALLAPRRPARVLACRSLRSQSGSRRDSPWPWHRAAASRSTTGVPPIECGGGQRQHEPSGPWRDLFGAMNRDLRGVLRPAGVAWGRGRRSKHAAEALQPPFPTLLFALLLLVHGKFRQRALRRLRRPCFLRC